jgi:hypothetical protein
MNNALRNTPAHVGFEECGRHYYFSSQSTSTVLVTSLVTVTGPVA